METYDTPEQELEYHQKMMEYYVQRMNVYSALWLKKHQLGLDTDKIDEMHDKAIKGYRKHERKVRKLKSKIAPD